MSRSSSSRDGLHEIARWLLLLLVDPRLLRRVSGARARSEIQSPGTWSSAAGGSSTAPAIPGSRATWRSAATGSRRSASSAPSATARKVIDARGLVVAPGFIDMHSHSDMTLLEDGDAPSKIRQGVTTEVLGEDSSAGPAKGKRPTGRFERDGKTLTWTTLGGYFDALEKPGHRPQRRQLRRPGHAAGLRAWATRWPGPTPAQLEAMKALLDEAMSDGAIGLSTMLAAPRELAVTTDDLVELCAVVRKHGGLFSSHIRNEGTEVLAAVHEAIAVGERPGVPVDIIHLKIADQSLWGRMPEIVALIDAGPRPRRQRPGQRLSLHPRQQRPGEHHPPLGPRRRGQPAARAAEGQGRCGRG